MKNQTISKQELKVYVRGMYDLQGSRIREGNRIVANYKAKLGQEPGHPEEELDAEGKKILKDIRASYKKITDSIGELPRPTSFKSDLVISSYSELCLIDSFMLISQNEENHKKRLKHMLKGFPVYDFFLQDITGVGPTMAGVIISEIDITKAQYASSIWKYCGLDVAQDGKGRSRRKEHREDTTYIDKEGDTQLKSGITFNPFIKTKLLGVLGPSFLKSKSSYAEYYYNKKNYYENHPNHAEKTKLHIHNMAMRYMVKRFLVDLYANWRALEKLPVYPEYKVAKLGLVHKGPADFDFSQFPAKAT